MPNYKVPLPIEDEASLRCYLEYGFGIRIPNVVVCPGHTAPWQFFCDVFFNRHRVVVLKASRGLGGKTFLLSTLGMAMATAQKADVTLLGGSGEQSKRLHDYMIAAWQHPTAPRYLLRNDPIKMETRLVWGNKISALLASSASVRGPHPQKLLIDEADECEMQVFLASLGQPLGKGTIPPQTVISSTHHYPAGTMTEILKMAAERGWPVYEHCYRETAEPHGWLAASEIEAKRQDIPFHMWQAEYELQAPSSEDRLIMPEAVEAMFDRDLGTFEGANGQYIEMEPPVRAGEYVTGCDWAKSHDWTVICTLRTDCAPARLVAFERIGRRPWPQMTARFEARLTRYGGLAQHDQTGLGSVVHDNLSQRAYGVVLTGRTRSDLISNYVNLVEKGALVAPRITYAYREHLYASVKEAYGAGHLPDTICAMALASVDCRAHRGHFVPIGT